MRKAELGVYPSDVPADRRLAPVRGPGNVPDGVAGDQGRGDVAFGAGQAAEAEKMTASHSNGFIYPGKGVGQLLVKGCGVQGGDDALNRGPLAAWLL